MSTISILPEILVNKIAAGEIIERPASVVRELLDNAIDAGAQTISVEVLYGGKKLIKVIDDGAGMDRKDASLCFERHATSKIKSEDDLFNIHTLGFRGEALASVASVSKVILITSTAHSPVGTKVEITTGHKKEITDASPLKGTTLEIRDIFYNTPARRKFLKSTQTESSHIIDIVTQKALSYPEITFFLKHNHSEVMGVSSAKDIKERFIQLYSEEMFNEFIEISRQGRGIKLYGFSSVREFARSAKNFQLIFMNRRPVKNPTIAHAVYSAYRDVIPKDKHPAYFLFFDIDPRKVDVNVHPAKREVRFEAPDEIHRIVEFSIRDVLHVHQGKTPDYKQSTVSTVYGTVQPAGEKKFGMYVIRDTLESALESGIEPLSASEDTQTDFFSERLVPVAKRYFYIGESFFAEAAHNGLVIIDQHAAHERILYEKLLKKTNIEVEQLFLPIRVELPAREFNIIMNHRELFHDVGLSIDDFGANNIIVRTVPRELQKADMRGLIIDTASGIMEQEHLGIKGDSGKQNLLHNIAARLACHTSVRGKEQLNNEELSQLVSDLDKTEMPDTCPHGRPTRVFFSLDDLRKMFKRK
jgi:DNA mismatch repair protein MutL